MAASSMKTEASVGLYASAGPSTSDGPRNFYIERSRGRQPVDADDGGVEPVGAELNQRRAPSSALSACSTALI